MKKPLKFKGFVLAILEKPDGTKEIYKTNNIVTNDGDVFYAQKGAGETPTNSFANLYLGSTATPNPGKASTLASLTLITGTEKAPKTGYPKTGDTDPDNTGGGANVVTYIYEYATTDGNWSSITEGAISVPAATGTEPVLCHFSFGTAFAKDSNTTLKVIVNHQVTGV